VVFAWLPKPVGIEAGRIVRRELVVSVEEDGRTRVKDRYTVSAPLSGNVARIELRAGDFVKQGAVVARLVPASAPLLDARTRKEAESRVGATGAARRQSLAQIERAKAALAYAKRENQRASTLAKSGAVPGVDLERSELDLAAREAELTSAQFGARVAEHEQAMARAALGAFTRRGKSQDGMDVPSPVSGQILKLIQVSEGIVPAGAPLLEVGDPAALEIVVDVLTADAVRIHPGSEVSVERWGGPALAGRVRLIEPSAFTRLSALGVEEQRVNVVVDLVAPYAKWSALKDGYRVEARIVVWKQSDVLVIPTSALFRRDGAWMCFVVREGRAWETKLDIGQQNGTDAEVLSGAEVDDVIVEHPSDRVTNGVRVEVR
jgi:HlyD family secretion protein